MEKLNKEVPHKLEQALLLSPEQTEAFHSYNFIATGFYGVGKTTVLEVAIQRIAEKSEEFPKPKIIFITWDKGKDLKNMFKEKFKTMREKYSHLNNEDSLEVLSLEEACRKYNVKPLQSLTIAAVLPWIGLDRNKVDVLNDLCKNLQGEPKTWMKVNLIHKNY